MWSRPIACLGLLVLASACGRFGFDHPSRSEDDGGLDASPRDGGADVGAQSIDAEVTGDTGDQDGGPPNDAAADSSATDADAGECACGADQVCIMSTCITRRGPTIAAGANTSCTIDVPGRLSCWGDGRGGELFTGTREMRGVAVEASADGTFSPAAVSAGGYVCIRSEDGQLRCDGNTRGAQIARGTVFATGIVDLGVGLFHACAVTADGHVRCFGFNDSSQLGDGTMMSRFTSTSEVVGLSDAVFVSGGFYHTCAVRSGGVLACWGSNQANQLGVPSGTTSSSTTPITVPGLTGVIGVAAGGTHTCALLATGRVTCFGDDAAGQLGDGTAGGARANAVEVPGLSGVVQVAAGEATTCALRDDGVVLCWGRNTFGQTGLPLSASQPTPMPVPTVSGAVEISMKHSHACAKQGDGVIRCWGTNTHGQLGHGTVPRALTPVEVPGITTAVAVAAGVGHTCVVLASGAAQCWGDNTGRQLGDGTSTSRVSPVSVSALTAAIDVSAGSRHTCFVKSGGAVTCYGTNGSGQLGWDPATSAPPPGTSIAGLSGVTRISSGLEFNCALRSDDRVLCWGANTGGQLGRASGDLAPTHAPAEPLLPAGEGFTSMTAGNAHACAVREPDGRVYCWGANNYGQIGDGTTTSRATPVLLSTVADASEVAAGGIHTCATGIDRLYCWGHNGFGQIGDGTSGVTSRPSPVAVTISPVPTRVQTGGTFSCALSSDGVRCFGENHVGEVGDGTTLLRATPTRSTLAAGPVTDFSLGSHHACAVIGGRVHCWGWNNAGQLGTGEVAYAAPGVVALP